MTDDDDDEVTTAALFVGICGILIPVEDGISTTKRRCRCRRANERFFLLTLFLFHTTILEPRKKFDGI
uniref:Uncharacterized protein n=1 Tax=Romanomermis culicivorax TaxID=13658 RepID=A0A915IPZ7_ROMCU